MEQTNNNHKIPQISVVVPVYNVINYLEKCVDSICKQTFTDLEILLVDDGSTDGSSQMCDQLAERDSRIQVIHKENGGLSDARNAGIQAAKGNYIGLVDSDDYIAEDMYETMYHNLTKEQADIAACGIYFCYEDQVTTSGGTGYEVVSGYEMLERTLLMKIQVSACIKLYKKELLLETPFAKGRLFEDAFLLGQLYPKAKKVVIDYTPKYYYIRRTGSITTKPYRAKDLDIIYAYEQNFQIVKEQCPQYMEAAWYRLIWAHYKALERMMLTDTQEARDGIKKVKGFLRKNIGQVLKNSNFTRNRKLALVLFLLSEKTYCKLERKKARKLNENGV